MQQSIYNELRQSDGQTKTPMEKMSLWGALEKVAFPVASESSFNATTKIKAGKRAGHAHGLMQVTDWTIEILQDEKGELTDHLVNVDQKDMTNANLNIAAGIRWLFRKKETASARLGRTATWEETVAEYKAYLSDMIRDPKNVPRNMRDFKEFYDKLRNK